MILDESTLKKKKKREKKLVLNYSNEPCEKNHLNNEVTFKAR